ncbi:hypothetical protein [Kitasatospora sp. NPDC088134]|uniref:hypothetical protein n=1 Tax=Kitasatospora sp. NPDC088134 TaxID=3364071 RepID=UPI0037F9347E
MQHFITAAPSGPPTAAKFLLLLCGAWFSMCGTVLLVASDRVAAFFAEQRKNIPSPTFRTTVSAAAVSSYGAVSLVVGIGLLGGAVYLLFVR